MLASPSKSCLYFVRDAKAAVCTDFIKGCRQIAFRILHCSTNTLHTQKEKLIFPQLGLCGLLFFGLGNFRNDLNRLGKKSRQFSALWQRILENFVHLVQVFWPCGAKAVLTLTLAFSLHRRVTAVCTTPQAFIRIRIHDVMCPKAIGEPVLPVPVGRQPVGVGTGPVVGVPEGQHVEVARVLPGHHHGHVVGLGPAVDEVDALQGVGQGGCQLLCIFMNLGMHVNASSVP